MANNSEQEAREEAVRRSQREAAQQRAERYFQRRQAERSQAIRETAAKRNENDRYPVWTTIPWEKVYPDENYNRNKTNAMFVVGNLINLSTGEFGNPDFAPGRMQIVDKKFGIVLGVEWWYQIVSPYGKLPSKSWYTESDMTKYHMTREWAPNDKEFINPQNFRKVFSKGDRLSLLFDEKKPTAKVYGGIITKKIQTFENVNRERELIGYEITFEDGDKLVLNHYRLLWMLHQTARYLAPIPIAKVGEYTGGDIPIARRGLKLRF